MSTDFRRTVGQEGERLAAEHLERLGFTVVARNYRTRFGELDLVAFDGHTLVFCEVKARRDFGGGGVMPLEAVGPAKQRRVRRMAMRYLAEVPDRPRARQLRFDAIGVTFDSRARLGSLEHLEGVF